MMMDGVQEHDDAAHAGERLRAGMPARAVGALPLGGRLDASSLGLEGMKF